jgi:hypothetical protein
MNRQLLRSMVAPILPRGVRKDNLDDLDEYKGSGLPLVLQSASSVIGGYRIQAVEAFNKYAFLAETGLIVFCFAASSLPHRLVIALVAVLSALTLRDAYTHDNGRSPVSQYYLDSAGDAITAFLFLVAAETLALKVSPSLAFPAPVLYRGAIICLPLISTLRMVLRVKPDPQEPFPGSRMSAEELYRRTWRLNILWLGPFLGVMAENVSDYPSVLDRFRGSVPLLTFLLWIAVQRDPLSRRSKLVTLFTNLRKQMLGRKKETLAQGIPKGKPFYWLCAGLEALIFLELTASLVEVLWPCLSGRETGLIRPVISLIAFATSVISWKYVKNANLAAAAALQAEIDAAEGR